MSAFLIGALLACHAPLRRGSLTILRFPFTFATACLRVIVTLPQLPSLGSENAALRAQVLQRELETARLREALRGSQHSRRLLESAPASSRGIVAGVIGRSTIPTQQTVLLDRGGRDGLAVEDVVLDSSGVVGRVIEIHPTTALVLLLTDSESRVAAAVERSRESGLLVGLARGRCELIYLDAQADVQPADRIVTAGLGGLFPKGLTLGTVVRVTRDQASGSASALVEPAAHLGRLEEVLCLPSQTRE